MNDVERLALKRLEAALRRMLYYTWEEDVDEDAAVEMQRVRRALDDLDAVRRVTEQQGEKP